LKPRGLWAVTIDLGNGWVPFGECILSGKSPRGDFLHSVVADGLTIIHDPHPSRAGILTQEDVVVLIPRRIYGSYSSVCTCDEDEDPCAVCEHPLQRDLPWCPEYPCAVCEHPLQRDLPWCPECPHGAKS